MQQHTLDQETLYGLAKLATDLRSRFLVKALSTLNSAPPDESSLEQVLFHSSVKLNRRYSKRAHAKADK